MISLESKLSYIKTSHMIIMVIIILALYPTKWSRDAEALMYIYR